MTRWRRSFLATAHGRVLEIGVGTGLNIAHYPLGVEAVAVEPAGPMLKRARRRRREHGRAMHLIQAQAEDLPFRDATFDEVVATFVFCTVADAARGLHEARRVLRPGGRLRLLEHVRMPQPALAWFQDLILPLWMRVAGGCHPNRDTLRTVQENGFEVIAATSRLKGLILEIEAQPV